MKREAWTERRKRGPKHHSRGTAQDFPESVSTGIRDNDKKYNFQLESNQNNFLPSRVHLVENTHRYQNFYDLSLLQRVKIPPKLMKKLSVT